MGYMVCKRCNGYYELQKGESPDDYDRCQCRGSLKHVLYLDSDIDPKFNSYDNIKVCSKCGKDNIKTTQICVFCGKSFETKVNFENKEKSSSSIVLRMIAVLVGISVVIIPSFLLSVDYWFMIIIGSFTTSAIASKNEKSGILYGAVTGLIASLIFIANQDNMLNLYNIVYLIGLSIGIILIPTIFGLIGGLIAAVIKNRIKTNKSY